MTVLAFDVYGTLIDTAGVVAKLGRLVGDKAGAFARIWRDKQLEYSFRRGLMRCYAPFPTCVRDAFDYTCEALGTPLRGRDREELLGAYAELPPFADVAAGLSAFNPGEFALYACSNGTAADVAGLLRRAGIGERFVDIVSVDEIGTFKPSPDVYRHFLKRSAARAEHAWLVSSNPFDVIGAVAAGMRGAWVKRGDNAVFDPWSVEPTLTVSSLLELRDRIADHRPGQ